MASKAIRQIVAFDLLIMEDGSSRIIQRLDRQDSDWLSIKEAAYCLGVSEGHIYLLADTGKLESQRSADTGRLEISLFSLQKHPRFNRH